MFLSIIVLAWRRGSRAIALSKGHPEVAWAADMARMVQVSLVAYLSGGAFLSLSYFDLPWQLYGMLILLERIVVEAVVPIKNGKQTVQATKTSAPNGRSALGRT